MDLSGIIFVVVALAWAVYLIPKALKHHDEIARTRSIDRFSTAMRVLARREPVNHRDVRLVVTPPRPAGSSRVLVPRPASAAVAAVDASAPDRDSAGIRRPATRSAPQRAAARAAAKRRRRILIFLVVVDLVVVGVAAFALLPWWSVSVPVVLTLAYLCICRRQVTRMNAAFLPDELPATPETEQGEVVARRAIRIDAPYGTPLPSLASRSDRGLDQAALGEEDTVAFATSVDRGSLWDPLPLTLPTYVSKPRAARTVRTIDLSEPRTWTSGHSEADTKLIEATADVQEDVATEQTDQRAVGS